MKAETLFNKTAKGQAEMESRSHGLSARQRRVLILINGYNDVAELQRLVQFDDAIDIIGFLLTDGFIEPSSEEPQSTSVAARDYSLN
jgi:hypothetical protein